MKNKILYFIILLFAFSCSLEKFHEDEEVAVSDSLAIADFEIENNNCQAPCNVQFINNSQNSVSSSWDFGDGETSEDSNPQHKYELPGSYSVTLTVIDENNIPHQVSKIAIINKRVFSYIPFSSNERGSLNDVEIDADGSYIFIGSIYNQSDFFLLKMNADETIEIQSPIDVGTDSDYGVNISNTANEGFLLSGRSLDELRVLIVDRFGSVEFNESVSFNLCTHGGYNERLDSVSFIIVSESNDCDFTTPDDRMHITKIDINADVEWTIEHSDITAAWGADIVKTSDGNFAVLATKGVGIKEMVLMKVDLEGNVLWTEYIQVDNLITVSGLIESSTGEFVLVGSRSGDSSWDAVYLKTDANGNELWRQYFGGDGVDEFYGLDETEDGGFIFCGSTSSFGALEFDAILMKTDVSGNFLWKELYGGTFNDSAADVAETNDGGFIVAATKSIANNVAVPWVLKTDSEGKLE